SSPNSPWPPTSTSSTSPAETGNVAFASPPAPATEEPPGFPPPSPPTTSRPTDCTPPDGTVKLCGPPGRLNANEHVATLSGGRLYEQPAGNGAAAARPASMTAHNPNTPTRTAATTPARPRSPTNADPALRARSNTISTTKSR